MMHSAEGWCMLVQVVHGGAGLCWMVQCGAGWLLGGAR